MAAPPLKWADGDAVTGNVGGGVWYASSHTANPEAVKTFLKFVISDPKTAGTGGLPAYQAAADAWLDSTGGERLLRRRLQGGDLGRCVQRLERLGLPELLA